MKKVSLLRIEQTGIPIEIVFESLFVPSISTKTIAMTTTNENYDKQNKTGFFMMKNNTQNYSLAISVNNIIIVKVGQNYHPNFNKILLIDMPPNTPLPVSRDDIIFDKTTLLIFEKNVRILYDKALSNKKKNIAHTRLALESYKKYTNDENVKKIIDRVWSDYFEKYKGLMVYEYYYKTLRKFGPSVSLQFIKSDMMSPEDLTVTFSKIKDFKLIENVFYGKKIVVIPNSDEIKSIVPSYLFVGDDIITRNKKWKINLPLSFSNEILFPENNTIAEKIYKEVIKLVDENFSGYDELKKKITDILIYFKSLDVTYKISQNDYNYTLLLFMRDHLKLSRKTFTNEFIEGLYTVINKNKQNKTSYGSGKTELTLLYGDIDFNYVKYVSVGNREKFLRFCSQWQIFGLNQSPAIWGQLYYWGKNNPISVDVSQNRRKIIVDFLVDNCKDYKQFIVFFALLCIGDGAAIKYGDTNSDIKKFNEEIDLASFGRLVDYYKKINMTNNTFRFLFYSKSFFETRSFDLFLEEIKSWNITRKNYELIKKKEFTASKNFQYSGFTINTMINYLFENNVDFSGTAKRDIKKFFEGVEHYKNENTKLQLVEIAINEGTTRNALEATLVELIQNSIDAIRSVGPNKYGKYNEIHINTSITTDRKYFVMKVKDYIGMPDPAFVYVSIPFLSTKDPSALVSGEMGSGFFNIYRESEFVHVKSHKDGYLKEYFDIPVKNSTTGRVLDVRKNVNIKKDGGLPGSTSIKSYMKINNQNDVILMLSLIGYYCNKVLSNVNVCPIYLNNTLINGAETEFLFHDANFMAYTCNKNREDNSLLPESYIMTKGIPFISFRTVYEKLVNWELYPWLEKGLSLDVLHNSYTPIQTRTSIRMGKEMKEKFNTAILNMIYLSTLQYYGTGISRRDNSFLVKTTDLIIPNTSSTASALQLKFNSGIKFKLRTSEYDPSNTFVEFILYYKYKKVCIAELINECIDEISPKHGIYIYQKVINKIESIKNIDQQKAVMRWFELFLNPDTKKSKLEMAIVSINEKIKLEKDIEPEKVKKKHLFFFQSCVDVYWEMAKGLKIKGFVGAPPRVKFSRKIEGVSAFYTPSDHSLTLVMSNIREKDIDFLYKTFKNYKEDVIISLRYGTLKNELWKNYFSLSNPASTLCHELEHARNRSSHAGGAHDDISGDIIPNFGKTKFTFDELALGVYSKIIEGGFFQKVGKVMSKSKNY